MIATPTVKRTDKSSKKGSTDALHCIWKHRSRETCIFASWLLCTSQPSFPNIFFGLIYSSRWAQTDLRLGRENWDITFVISLQADSPATGKRRVSAHHHFHRSQRDREAQSWSTGSPESPDSILLADTGQSAKHHKRFTWPSLEGSTGRQMHEWYNTGCILSFSKAVSMPTPFISFSSGPVQWPSLMCSKNQGEVGYGRSLGGVVS